MDVDAVAKEITDELFKQDSKPETEMPQLLGGDLCDPNYAGIRKVIADVLRRHSAPSKEEGK